MILALTILLTWADAANPPTATYHVYRATGACSDFSKFERVTPAPLAAKTFQDLPGAGSFCYRVTAMVEGVESQPSAAITVATRPAAPTALTAKPAPG